MERILEVKNNFNLGTATEMVVKLKQDVGRGCIALGEWIQLTYDNLPYNEYLEWLTQEVKISRSQAWRFMKIAKEVDYQTLERIGTSKMFDILSLPDSKFKSELIEKAHETTVKDIREQVKEYKAKQETGKIEEAEIIELPNPVDQVMKMNINFLDGLDALDVSIIQEDYKPLIRSQLTQTLEAVNKFLSELNGE